MDCHVIMIGSLVVVTSDQSPQHEQFVSYWQARVFSAGNQSTGDVQGRWQGDEGGRGEHAKAANCRLVSWFIKRYGHGYVMIDLSLLIIWHSSWTHSAVRDLDCVCFRTRNRSSRGPVLNITWVSQCKLLAGWVTGYSTSWYWKF